MGTERAILGVNFDYHDASAALVINGQVVAAAEEERFTRRKHDPSIPAEVIAWLIREVGLGSDDLEAVAFHGKPMAAFERVVGGSVLAGPRHVRDLDRAVSLWGRSKLWVAYRLDVLLTDLGIRTPRIVYVDHHRSHAASAFYPSPFDSAAFLTLDGVGDRETGSYGTGNGARLTTLATMAYPDSLGLFYSAMTAHCGFDVNDGEYKLMGLAPYGRPTFETAMRREMIQVNEDGSTQLDLRMLRVGSSSHRLLDARADALLGGPPRDPDAPIGQREADIARSAQAIVEDAVLAAARHVRRRTGETNLCLAGGVALNCVANDRIIEDGGFENVWCQPAAGDGGGSVGAALWTHHHVYGAERTAHRPDGMAGSLLGPSTPTDDVRAWLDGAGLRYREIEESDRLTEEVARRLAHGDVVGWCQGRMEFGPRALGNRSILADPRDPAVVQRINEMVKGREGFRPLAPAVLEHEADRWFAMNQARAGLGRYMLATGHVLDHDPGASSDDRSIDEGAASWLGERRSALGACTHVDGSARPQFVSAELNPRFHALITAFSAETGIGVLLNTSFNLAGEPIVRTPREAARCAATAGLDLLVVDQFLVDGRELRSPRRTAEAVAR